MQHVWYICKLRTLQLSCLKSDFIKGLPDIINISYPHIVYKYLRYSNIYVLNLVFEGFQFILNISFLIVTFNNRNRVRCAAEMKHDINLQSSSHVCGVPLSRHLSIFLCTQTHAHTDTDVRTYNWMCWHILSLAFNSHGVTFCFPGDGQSRILDCLPPLASVVVVIIVITISLLLFKLFYSAYLSYTLQRHICNVWHVVWLSLSISLSLCSLSLGAMFFSPQQMLERINCILFALHFFLCIPCNQR